MARVGEHHNTASPLSTKLCSLLGRPGSAQPGAQRKLRPVADALDFDFFLTLDENKVFDKCQRRLQLLPLCRTPWIDDLRARRFREVGCETFLFLIGVSVRISTTMHTSEKGIRCHKKHYELLYHA